MLQTGYHNLSYKFWRVQAQQIFRIIQLNYAKDMHVNVFRLLFSVTAVSIADMNPESTPSIFIFISVDISEKKHP